VITVNNKYKLHFYLYLCYFIQLEYTRYNITLSTALACREIRFASGEDSHGVPCYWTNYFRITM